MSGSDRQRSGGQEPLYAGLTDGKARARLVETLGTDPWKIGFCRDTLVSHPGDPGAREWLAGLGLAFCEETLGGHAETITAFAWAPNGELVATGGRDGLVKVWAAASGRELWTPLAFSSGVNGLAFSPCGRLLAAGAADGAVGLCRPAEPGPPAWWREDGDGVCSLAFSPDGARLAVGLRGGGTRLLAVGVAGGRLQRVGSISQASLVAAVVWLDGGNRLVTLTGGGYLRVWEVPPEGAAVPPAAPPKQTGKPKAMAAAVSRPRARGGKAASPEASPGGKGGRKPAVSAGSASPAAGSRPKPRGGKAAPTAPPSAEPETSAANPAGPGPSSSAAGGPADRGSPGRHPETGSRGAAPARKGAGGAGTRASARLGAPALGGAVAGAGSAPAAPSKPVVEFWALDGGADGAALSPDGSTLATWSALGECADLWNVADWEHRLAIKPQRVIHGVAWHPDGKRLAVAMNPLGLAFLDLGTKKWCGRLRSARPVRSLAWNAAGDRLGVVLESSDYLAPDQPLAGIAGGGFTIVRADPETLELPDLEAPAILLDPAREQATIALRPGFAGVEDLAWSPDGRLLAAGLWQYRRPAPAAVRLYDTETRREVAAFPHGTYAGSVAWSPDGRRLAAASQREFVRVWDVAAKAATAHLKTPAARSFDQDQWATQVAWMPDGARLLVACADERLRLLDATTGEVRTAFGKGHARPVHQVGLSRDGAVVVSLEREGRELLVWRVDSPDSPAARLPLPGPAGCFALASSGSRLAVALQARGVVLVLDPATGREEARLSGQAGRVLALVWSPDETALAAGSTDGTVRLWQVPSGKETRCLPLPPTTPRRLSWSPDGRRLAVGSTEIALITV
ncbi:MAG: hypothetical protein GX442_05125 [Candidatus Riflebacteria bacterium]|nr:hypothetical protein [Candidatus Riflebacteria bacterium]